MTTFLEKLKAYYIPGWRYRFPDGQICIFKMFYEHRCDDGCHGQFGECDGSELVFENRGPACVYINNCTRCHTVVQPQSTNSRW